MNGKTNVVSISNSCPSFRAALELAIVPQLCCALRKAQGKLLDVSKAHKILYLHMLNASNVYAFLHHSARLFILISYIFQRKIAFGGHF